MVPDALEDCNMTKETMNDLEDILSDLEGLTNWLADVIEKAKKED